jgi:hypothetical protein
MNTEQIKAMIEKNAARIAELDGGKVNTAAGEHNIAELAQAFVASR